MWLLEAHDSIMRCTNSLCIYKPHTTFVCFMTTITNESQLALHAVIYYTSSRSVSEEDGGFTVWVRGILLFFLLLFPFFHCPFIIFLVIFLINPLSDKRQTYVHMHAHMHTDIPQKGGVYECYSNGTARVSQQVRKYMYML